MAVPSTHTRILHIDSIERRRIISLALRLRTARYQALAFFIPALVLAYTAYGPMYLPWVGGILGGFAGLALVMYHSRHPERALLAMLVWVQFMLAGMIATVDYYPVDALGLLILPAVASCLLFPARIAAGFLGWTAVAMVGLALGVDAARVADSPPILILPIGVMFCVSLPAVTVRKLDVASRDTAMIDTLTGALNRTALELRLTELAEQGGALPLRVGVVMADLDHFKAINDELGHAQGDVVLRETVRRIRAELGPLTPVYRAGGEEFVVLIAGADKATITDVGERVRRAVRATPIDERAVTISVGVAASTIDRHPAKTLLAKADDALYEAKRAGRDRVAVAAIAGGTSTPGLDRQPAAAVGAGPLSLVTAPRPETPAVHRESLAATAVSLGHDERNWLVRGDFEREHIRSSARAMAGTHHGALGMIGLALAASIPWMGWHLMLPAILPVISYHVVERRIRKLRRPEYALGIAWTSVQLGIFGGALLAENGQPYMLVLFVAMMISVTAVFPSRGILVASLITIALVSVGGALSRPDLVGAHPGLLAPPILIIAGFALMSSTAGRSAIAFSTQAVVDPLTGLLTRAALRSRLEELGQQAVVESAAVSVVTFDVDAFKDINDTHGHAVGDAVLQAVGAATRRHLRALEWGFRLGGDEFLVVLPAGEEQAARLASTLRAALAGIDVGGIGITGSFGVATSPAGGAFDFDATSARADAALYEAKRSGRNRVAVAPPGPATLTDAPQALPHVA